MLAFLNVRFLVDKFHCQVDAILSSFLKIRVCMSVMLSIGALLNLVKGAECCVTVLSLCKAYMYMYDKL